MVAIKHFVMPSCCDNCDIFDWNDKACRITYTRCENPFDDRNDDCPLIEVEPQESEETETWNSIHAQITAPKGTFERIFNDADDDNDI